MVELSDMDRSSLRGLFVAWAIASVPALIWTVLELNRFYGPENNRAWWYVADSIVQGTFNEAIVFGTIGYALVRLTMVRYEGTLPLGWSHPLLSDYRPAGLPASETALDRTLLGTKRRSAWRVPVGVTLSFLAVGLLFWFTNPNLFDSFASRGPMGNTALANAVVNTIAIVLATAFAYRRGGLIGCWGIIYGPVIVLALYQDPGATVPAVLGGLIESISYTAWMAVHAYLIGIALRWFLPDMLNRRNSVSTAEAS
jgi:hypothetical protein